MVTKVTDVVGQLKYDMVLKSFGIAVSVSDSKADSSGFYSQMEFGSVLNYKIIIIHDNKFMMLNLKIK